MRTTPLVPLCIFHLDQIYALMHSPFHQITEAMPLGRWEMAIVQGSEIKVGDVLSTWGGKVRVTELRPYDNDYARLNFPNGARLASFDKGPGMTVPNDMALELTSF